MKKVLSVLLLAVLLMGCLSSFAYASGYVYATGDMNVRTGPGLGYASIGTAYKGTTLTYLDDTSYDNRGVAWYKVSFRNSYGWVSSTYGSLSGASSYSGGGSYYGTSTVYVSGDSNIRSGPGLGYTLIGTANAGSTLTYLGSTSYDGRGVAWYMVSFGSGSGWVSSTYTVLGAYSSAPNTYGAGANNAPSYDYSSSYYGSYVKATGGDTNVRSGPGLGYSVLTTMYKGNTASYLGSSSVDGRGVAWYKVSYGGYTGWVSSTYTSLY